MVKTQVLSILSENTSGVLSRVAGLFARRRFNIDSITAGTTSDENYSRITIVTSGEGLILDQIENQVAKLEDVISVERLYPDDSVARELVLLRVKANDSNRTAIHSVCDIFRTKVVDITPDSMLIELTGSKRKISAFIELMGGYGIIQMARTGVTALARGEM